MSDAARDIMRLLHREDARPHLYEAIVAHLQAYYRDSTEQQKQAAAEQVLKIRCAEMRIDYRAYAVRVRHETGSPTGLALGVQPYRVFVEKRGAVDRLADLGHDLHAR